MNLQFFVKVREAHSSTKSAKELSWHKLRARLERVDFLCVSMCDRKTYFLNVLSCLVACPSLLHESGLRPFNERAHT